MFTIIHIAAVEYMCRLFIRNVVVDNGIQLQESLNII